MPSYRAAVRVLFRGDACQTDGFHTCTMVGTYGRFGLSIVNPAKGAAKRWRVTRRSPRGNLSARIPGPTPSAGVSSSVRDGPDFAVFLGRVCDAGTEEARREAH